MSAKKSPKKSIPDGARAFLRHTVATLAYRCGKAVRGAPASFAASSTSNP